MAIVKRLGKAGAVQQPLTSVIRTPKGQSTVFALGERRKTQVNEGKRM